MKKRILFATGVAVFLAAAFITYLIVFKGLLGEKIRIADVTGLVELQAEGGRWQNAEVGDVLSVQDTVRTAGDAKAVLEMPDEISVTVQDHTEINIEQLSKAVAKFRLSEGKIQANVNKERGKTLVIASASGDATAAAVDGAFSVVASNDGSLAVATERGSVDLTSAGATVKVESGKQSVAGVGKAPTRAVAIPTSVFLKVVWPQQQLTNKEDTVVSGKTDFGARIVIAGKTIPVAPDGSFNVRVALAEGKNQFALRAEDVAGNVVRDESPEIVRDSTAPDGTVDTESIWGD